jgi:integrase
MDTDMRTKIKMHFSPRYDKDVEGLVIINIDVRINGTRKPLNTGHKVKPEYWNRKKRCAENGSGFTKNEAESLNQKLEDLELEIKNLLKNCHDRGVTPTHSMIQQLIDHGYKPFNFIDFCKNYVKENPRRWSTGTIGSYQTFLALIQKAFPNGANYQDIPGMRLTLDKTMEKLQNGRNTKSKQHTKCKFLLKQARKAGYELADPYDESIPAIKGNRQIITPEEMNKLISLFKTNALPDHLNSTLRQFLFSCFTGCRFGDQKELTHKNVSGEMLSFIAEKTERYGIQIDIPMQQVSLALIENQRGKLFDMRCEQVVNRNLKQICRIARINKHITFHCARHTFGTLYIYLGGNLANLQMLMGHNKIDTTMNYVHLAGKIKLKDEHLFDDAFGEQMRITQNLGRGQFMAVI